MQLERSLVPGDVANDEFSDEISAQHAGMTPLALACALNKLPSVKVWRHTQMPSCILLRGQCVWKTIIRLGLV